MLLRLSQDDRRLALPSPCGHALRSANCKSGASQKVHPQQYSADGLGCPGVRLLQRGDPGWCHNDVDVNGQRVGLQENISAVVPRGWASSFGATVTTAGMTPREAG